MPPDLWETLLLPPCCPILSTLLIILKMYAENPQNIRICLPVSLEPNHRELHHSIVLCVHYDRELQAYDLGVPEYSD